MTDNISYTLDYTTEGTETLNPELIEYRSPAVIIQAEPTEPTIDELENTDCYYGSPEAEEAAEMLATLKKWKDGHSYKIDLAEEEDALQQYLDGDESGLTAQIEAETAAALKYAPDWIDKDTEKENLKTEIGYVLRSLYSMQLSQFEDTFLSNHIGITLDEYRSTPTGQKQSIFNSYWNWF